jgi:hypothetical protein
MQFITIITTMALAATVFAGNNDGRGSYCDTCTTVDAKQCGMDGGVQKCTIRADKKICWKTEDDCRKQGEKCKMTFWFSSVELWSLTTNTGVALGGPSAGPHCE